MKRLLLSSCCLLALLSQAFAQNQPTPEQIKRSQAAMKIAPYNMQYFVDAVGSGKTLGMYYTEDGDQPEYQKLTGTSQEQYDEFGDFMASLKEEIKPALTPLMDKVSEVNDPEELEALAGEIGVILNGVLDRTQAKLEEVVTPEQLMKMRQFELQQLSGMASIGLPIINFDAYKGLELNTDQMKELDKIRNESSAEQKEFMEGMFKMAPTAEQRKDPKKMQEFGKKMNEYMENGKKLTAKIKARVVSLLNKEQTAKLENLLANIPEFVKENQKKRGMPPAQVAKVENDDWKRSWKPGDPIPEHAREQEKMKRRVFPFPR